MVADFDEEQENIKNSASGASAASGSSDSDSSFAAEASDATVSPITTASLSPDLDELLLGHQGVQSEALGRGKRRASMSTISTASSKAFAAKTPAPAPAAPLVAKTAAASKATSVSDVAPALVLAEDYEKVTASMRSVTAAARKRRASCMPVPTAVQVPAAAAVPVRQSARRMSLAPPKTAPNSSTASNVAEVTTRVTRRKSLMLSAAVLEEAAAAPVVEVPEPIPTAEADPPMIEDNKPAAVSEPVEEPAPVEVVPTLDLGFDESATTSVSTRRRSMLRRTSFGGSDANVPAVATEPARTSNRRRSIAEVTAMLASIDSVQTIVPKGLAEPKASKKRPSDEADENAKRRKENTVLETFAHVWIDI